MQTKYSIGHWHRQSNEPTHNSKQTQVIDAKRGKARASKPTIGFGFASDWLKKWREIVLPISKRSNAKPM